MEWGEPGGLAYTQFAEATCGTIRLKLLKLGVLVRVSVRRIKLAMAQVPLGLLSARNRGPAGQSVQRSHRRRPNAQRSVV